MQRVAHSLPETILLDRCVKLPRVSRSEERPGVILVQKHGSVVHVPVTPVIAHIALLLSLSVLVDFLPVELKRMEIRLSIRGGRGEYEEQSIGVNEFVQLTAIVIR